MNEDRKLVGKVAHYYGKIGVAVVELEGPLRIGDDIAIEGPATSFMQKVESMQIEFEPVKEAKDGDAIGLKVSQTVKPKDNVYVMKKYQ
ncbi:MAG: translation elongation factor-like protein [Candidatus Aenigmarchaeota archaeon]|nr:translation elongation factor-like protein [Candidatus Aenigmarchaeota archaeon]